VSEIRASILWEESLHSRPGADARLDLLCGLIVSPVSPSKRGRGLARGDLAGSSMRRVLPFAGSRSVDSTAGLSGLRSWVPGDPRRSGAHARKSTSVTGNGDIDVLHENVPSGGLWAPLSEAE
jgi:hypothetical protein